MHVFKGVSWLKPDAKKGAKQPQSGFHVSSHKYGKATISALVSGTAVRLLANSNSNSG